MEAVGADIRTRREFAGSYKLHVEFRIPANPAKTPAGAGNSGVYLHGRYEVQILDNYRKGDEVHEADFQSCGAIFDLAAPRSNVCKAPGA